MKGETMRQSAWSLLERLWKEGQNVFVEKINGGFSASCHRLYDEEPKDFGQATGATAAEALENLCAELGYSERRL